MNRARFNALTVLGSPPKAGQAVGGNMRFIPPFHDPAPSRQHRLPALNRKPCLLEPCTQPKLSIPPSGRGVLALVD
jgi:hypothetical protein